MLKYVHSVTFLNVSVNSGGCTVLGSPLLPLTSALCVRDTGGSDEMECMHGMICGMEHAVRHASTRTKSVCASECVYLCLVVSERSLDGHQCRNDRLDYYLLFMLTYVETRTEVCSQCEFRSECSAYWEVRQ